MDTRIEPFAGVEPPVEVLAPADQLVPLVLASPHSGTDYPADFLAASRLDPVTLRRSEDSFVDEIFGAAPALGAPLLRARFARAYLDANREPFELDPQMFEDALPDFVNTRSPRVQVGLGTIARVVASGEYIYARKLRFAEAMTRIDRLYRPYHRALDQLLSTTRLRFGCYLLVDCHSMPSTVGPAERVPRRGGAIDLPRGGAGDLPRGAGDLPRSGADIVLGDCHGTACHPALIDTAQRLLTAQGYRVARNTPYAGGFTTCHYGRPGGGGHALQIEINRGLYMDERSFGRKPFLAHLAADMRELMSELGGLDRGLLLPT